jgi:hypothetical protein
LFPCLLEEVTCPHLLGSALPMGLYRARGLTHARLHCTVRGQSSSGWTLLTIKASVGGLVSIAVGDLGRFPVAAMPLQHRNIAMMVDSRLSALFWSSCEAVAPPRPFMSFRCVVGLEPPAEADGDLDLAVGRSTDVMWLENRGGPVETLFSPTPRIVVAVALKPGDRMSVALSTMGTLDTPGLGLSLFASVQSTDSVAYFSPRNNLNYINPVRAVYQ